MKDWTMWDHYAAAALSGSVASSTGKPESYAKFAALVADAMLAEREKRQTQQSGE